MECITTYCICRPILFNKIQYLLILNRIIEIDSDLQSCIHRITGMCTGHIQHQRILRMIFILASFLLVIHNIIINPNKLLHQSLLLRCIMTTCHSRMPLPQYLVPITMNILHSRRARLIIKHVKNLTKILRLINGPSIPNKEKHNTIRMILSLNVLIHPDLTQHINRLNTEPLTNPVGQPNTTGNITNTHDFTNVLDIMSGLK
nr:C5 protein [Euphorbia leaf curl virus]